MTRPVALLFVLAVALAAPGCTTNEIVDPLASAHLAERAKAAPLPLRLLVAPLEDARAYRSETTADVSGVADATLAPVPGFDAEAFRAEVGAALRRARVAERVDLAPDRQPGEPPPDLLARGFEKPLPDHLVLELRLLRYDVAYLGGVTHPARWWFTVGATLCWYAVAHWWVAAEDYECNLAVEATVRSVASERVVFHRTYAVPIRRQLCQWERGPSILGPILYRQISLDEWHFAEAAEVVAPPAREAFLADLAGDLKAIDPASPEVAGRHLVAVGAGVLDGRLGGRALLQAEKDAEEVHATLVSSGVVPAKNARLLTGGRATRKEILDAVRRAAGTARAPETLIVFFAGFGATVGGRPLLVTTDFDPDRPLETGIPLDELAAALDGPARQAVVVDASFAGAGEPAARTLAFAGADRAPDAEGLVRATDSLRRTGRVVVLSAGTAGIARSTERFGVFTSFLIEAVKSPAARPNATGEVTLNAVFDKVRRDTRNVLEEPPQEPAWIGSGKGAPDPAVPLYRRVSVPRSRRRRRR